MNLKGLIPSVCLLAFASAATLSQEQTNGASLYGTFDAPEIDEFLTDNPLPNGKPWGVKTANGTNPYNEPPNTGVTRHYKFTVARGLKAPDGYQKEVILINGQFPGPMIEANWGDWIEVQVTNKITNPEEGTAMHWHGLIQSATPWYDGTPSVQQCPIAPGATFTYRFKADLYGSSWYHSHYSSQYAGGLLGPMIIHGPSNYEYDIDLGPVFLSDYYHKEYFDIIQEIVSTNQSLWRTYSDNNLINGKMNYDCSKAKDGRPCKSNAPLAKFKFKKGKSHRLRLINAGAAGQQFFSIDGHELTVIANDFVPIKPYKTKTVFLGIGQRTDVVVEAIGAAKSSYWMRSNISTICNLPLQPQALAQIYYQGADTTKDPTSKPWPYTDNGRCNNDDLSLTTPFYPITPDPKPAKTYNIMIDAIVNATGHLEWRLNEQRFRGNYNKPLLLQAQQKNYTFAPEWNVIQPGNAKSVRFIVNNNSSISHPMHLHGHNMYVLQEGEGFYDNQPFVNPANPQRRDTQMVRPNGHIVVQFDADNPGVWPFHCHIAWHLSLGLYMNILERPQDVTSVDIPDIIPQTCRDWEAYSKRAIVEQIDSGLRKE